MPFHYAHPVTGKR